MTFSGLRLQVMTSGSPGQRDILQSLIAFACDKEREAVKEATDQGLQIVDEAEEEQ